MTNLSEYYLWAKEIEKQIIELDKPDIPLEAEIQTALVRNKLSQILPMIERLFILDTMSASIIRIVLLSSTFFTLIYLTLQSAQ